MYLYILCTRTPPPSLAIDFHTNNTWTRPSPVRFIQHIWIWIDACVQCILCKTVQWRRPTANVSPPNDNKSKNCSSRGRWVGGGAVARKYLRTIMYAYYKCQNVYIIRRRSTAVLFFPFFRETLHPTGKILKKTTRTNSHRTRVLLSFTSCYYY